MQRFPIHAELKIPDELRSTVQRSIRLNIEGRGSNSASDFGIMLIVDRWNEDAADEKI